MCKTISMRQNNLMLEELKSFSTSPRTISEKVLGLFLFFSLSIATFAMHLWIAKQGMNNAWYLHLAKAEWIMQNWAVSPIWCIYYLIPCFSTWLIWRKTSIYKTKLEVALFFSQFFWLLFWVISFFYLQIPLLSLFSLLFALSNTIVHALVLQKNEKLTKYLLTPAFLWLFYMIGINMMFCVTNP